MTATHPTPTEIRLRKQSRVLDVAFGETERYSLPFEYLRVHSPSAEVQGHGPGQETLVLGKQHVMITAVEPIGQYAVRLVFDDGHDTGLYTWKYLRELLPGLGVDQDDGSAFEWDARVARPPVGM